jgi:hypothetical protein
MSDEWIGWHFLRADRRLGYEDGRLVAVGETLRLPEGQKPAMCKRGFHASRKAKDALSYAPGDVICKVRLSGEIIEGDDKAVASERTVLAMADATNTLHEYACWCAEQVAHLAGQHEAVCRRAIDAKRNWLRGEASDEELAAARAAAWGAARAAAWGAARAAAWGAARDAAWAAARDAAWAAAWGAAWDAAWAAAWDAQEAKLCELFNELLEIQTGDQS